MTSETDYLTMGLNTGTFLLASLIAEGYMMSPRGAEIMKDYAARDIDKITGMPAEDFAMQMEPALRVMLDAVERGQK
jgi:hypothetical protein